MTKVFLDKILRALNMFYEVINLFIKCVNIHITEPCLTQTSFKQSRSLEMEGMGIIVFRIKRKVFLYKKGNKKIGQQLDIVFLYSPFMHVFE